MITQRLAVMAVLLAFVLAPLSAAAANGFYVGASFGSASLDEDFDGLAIDDDTISYRLVGGWKLNDYFGLEAGYHDFGDFETDLDINGVTSTLKLSADGFTLGATGSAPLNEQFSLFGRAGWFFWDGEAEINNVSQATPGDTNLYLGAGVSYAFTKKFSVTGDWTRYDLESADSNVLSIGLQFSFGR